MDKAEVACRHLVTALALHIDNRCPVSVHVLACAGAEIADSLSVQAGRKPFRLFRTSEQGREISDKDPYRIRNKYYNAFKLNHMIGGKDRDDSLILDRFSEIEKDDWLSMAWFDYACAG